jgi:hypothetical protein
VRQTLEEMPVFEPVIMSRLCNMKCYEPESHYVLNLPRQEIKG